MMTMMMIGLAMTNYSRDSRQSSSVHILGCFWKNAYIYTYFIM